jgi:DNA-binding NtrC family response regulator
MSRPSIVVHAVHEPFSREVTSALVRRGLRVAGTSSPVELLRLLRKRLVQVLVLGCPSRGDEELEIARAVRSTAPTVPVILVTATSSEELAIAALRAGVADYLRPPLSLDTVVGAVERQLASMTPAVSGVEDEAALVGTDRMNRMIAVDPSMTRLGPYLARLAAADCPVLITGETGTGKELTAHLIHDRSPRRQQTLACINCAAIPDTLVESELFGYERGAFTGAHGARAGALEAANGGTVLLDEIGEMTPYAQAKLLRVIETREVQPLGGRRAVPLDIRLLAATNQDLESLVAMGRFRKDLYYRLNVARIHLPPLRERRGDIAALVRHFCRQLGLRAADDPADPTLQALQRHDWPGNVRELRNVLEAVAIASPSGRLSLRDLPPQLWPQPGLARVPGASDTPAAAIATARAAGSTAGSPGSNELDRLLSALSLTNWNKSQAAARLQWSRMTLYRKLAKYGIGASDAGTRTGGPTTL